VTFLVSQFFLGVGLAVVMPCLPLIVKEWTPKRPGFATGLYISGYAAGSATALGLTPYLLELLSWRHILLVYSSLAIILALLWWALAISTAKPTMGLQLKSFVGFLKERYVWVLMVFMMASFGSYDTLTVWLPKILDVKGLDPTLAILLPLGYLLAGPTVGLISDRFQNTRAIVALLGIIAAVAIVSINYAPVSLLLLCVFVAGFSTMGVLTIILSVPTHHPRLASMAASVVGLVSSLGNLMSLTMPVFFGYLIDVTGTFQASLFTIAALVGIMLVIGSRMSE
jgi:cyanate permease